MEDNRFDDILRSKIGEFEPEGFDPSALSGLHYKMGAGFALPWYARYRTEMLIGASTVILASILFYGQWRMGQENNDYRQELAALKNHNAELLDMQRQNSNVAHVPDTVRIVEYRNANDLNYNALVREIQALKSSINTAKLQPIPTEDYKINRQLVYIGKEGDLTLDLIAELKKEGSLVKNGEHVFMLVDDELIADNSAYFVKRKGLVENYMLPTYEFVDGEEEMAIAEKDIKTKPVQISLSKFRELEKHYKKGVGFEFGPSVQLYRTNYSPGSSGMGYGTGLLSHFILSRNLSIQAGVVFNALQYNLKGYELKDEVKIYSDEALGELKGVDFRPIFFEIPIALNYRSRLNYKSHLTLGAGVSPQLYTQQRIEYYYNYDAGNNVFLPIESGHSEKGVSVYVGTANLSIGISKTLKNKNRIETSLFYKKSIGTVGIEKAQVNYFGIGSTYQILNK